MWKKILAGCLIAAMLAVFAQEPQKNRVKNNWRIWANSKGTIIDARTSEIYCKNMTDQEKAGVWQEIILNQTQPEKLLISAESKADRIPAGARTASSNYCIYVDITYTDGQKQFGIVAPFEYSNHDWEKAETAFTPSKPVRSANFHLLFRGAAGDVVFRNITLRAADEPGK